MVRRDLDLQIILLVISRAFENLYSSEVLSELPFTFNEVLDGFIKIITEGILTEKARRKKVSAPGNI